MSLDRCVFCVFGSQHTKANIIQNVFANSAQYTFWSEYYRLCMWCKASDFSWMISKSWCCCCWCRLCCYRCYLSYSVSSYELSSCVVLVSFHIFIFLLLFLFLMLIVSHFLFMLISLLAKHTQKYLFLLSHTTAHRTLRCLLWLYYIYTHRSRPNKTLFIRFGIY